MTRDEAIRKAAALLRLAERGGTVGEAGAAAARAQALMEKFELTKAAIGGAEQAAEGEEEIDNFAAKPEGWMDTMKWVEVWKSSLAGSIARANDCFIYNGRRGVGRSIEIVCRPSQVELVRVMYDYLKVEIERLCNAHGRGMGAVWKREFREGAAREVGVILKELRKKTAVAVLEEFAGNSMALVRVNAALVKMDGGRASELVARGSVRLVSGGTRSVQHNGSARAAGAAAARSIDYSKTGSKRIGN